MRAFRAECVQLDPHPVVHEAGSALLSHIGIAVVTATTSAERALHAISLHHPELFMIEPLLPEYALTGGLECIRRSLLVDDGLAVVAFSARDEMAWRSAVFAAGAAAFVPKSAPSWILQATIIDALERARCGDEPLASHLTPREREILALIAEHRTNAEVARMLWLSPETVKFHVANAFRKLHVSSRTEAARWARRHELTVRERATAETQRPATGTGLAKRATRAFAGRQSEN